MKLMPIYINKEDIQDHTNLSLRLLEENLGHSSKV